MSGGSCENTHIFFILKTDKVIVSLSWLLISVLRHIITYIISEESTGSETIMKQRIILAFCSILSPKCYYFSCVLKTDVHYVKSSCLHSCKQELGYDIYIYAALSLKHSSRLQQQKMALCIRKEMCNR